MEMFKTLFLKAMSLVGVNVPDVVNDDMASDTEERSTEERRDKFAAFAAVEEEVKEEAAEDAAIITEVAETGDGWGAIYDFLAEGKKILAIKAYREMEGASLKEAKEAIDAIIAERGVA